MKPIDPNGLRWWSSTGVVALPDRIGLFSAWIAGFFMDVLEGSLLGLNALALALVAYLALSLYQRMRMFTGDSAKQHYFDPGGHTPVIIFLGTYRE